MAQTLPAAISGAGRKGREEEGSGDSEQDAVAKWNVIIFILHVTYLKYTILVVNRAHS